MGFFRRHAGRGSYDLFTNHSHYVPGYSGMVMLFVMFLIGTLIGSMIVGAMGQAFFSLSLGLTCLLTYASYFSNKTPLVKSATIIAVLDTCVAILAGAIIFPAVFSFGAEPTAGPKLVFEVLPNIFQQMPGGYFWSLAFFMLLFFASITSTISMSEIFITFCTEERRPLLGELCGEHYHSDGIWLILCIVIQHIK